MCDIVVGDYQLGLKFANEKGTHYMLCTANSFGADSQYVAVGKAVDGKIYLVSECFPNGDYSMSFRVIPEEHIYRNEREFRPRS